MTFTVLPTVPCTRKKHFCLGTLSTDEFENADRVPEPFEPSLNPPLMLQLAPLSPSLRWMS